MKLPFEGTIYISSAYGNRTLNGVPNWHSGLDLVGQDCKTIYAPCDGTIGASTIITDKSNKTWEWGNYIRIDSQGYQIYMCHMSERYVKVGDKVKCGQPIGKEGNTGYSFGSHCHFEIRQNGTAINPCPILGIQNKTGVYLTNTFKKEDEVMTGEEIYKALNDYLKTLPESEWSKREGSLDALKEMGITDGTKPKAFVSREELFAIVMRTIGALTGNEKEK